jgi:aminomethyltransferase
LRVYPWHLIIDCCAIVEKGFLGANHFLLPDGTVKPVSRKKVGIAGMKAPARGDTEVYSAGDGARRIDRISFRPALRSRVLPQ